MASVRSRRSLGKGLIIGGLALGLVTPTVSNGDLGKGTDLLTVALVSAAAGTYLAFSSHPSDEFWQTTMGRVKVGETRTEDLSQCLGRPSTTTVSGNEETWTYQTAHSGFLGLGGSARSVNITLKDGVVAGVRRTDFAY